MEHGYTTVSVSDWRLLTLSALLLAPFLWFNEGTRSVVTRGDTDHAEYVPHVARASGAPVVCGLPLAERWRREGIMVVPLAVGERVQVTGVPVEGVPVRHGGLALTLFGHTLTFKPPSVGVGAIGLCFPLERGESFEL